MKYVQFFLVVPTKRSLPVRGAWIEISYMGIADSEISASLPVRGAWIEISSNWAWKMACIVAPRAGSVD